MSINRYQPPTADLQMSKHPEGLRPSVPAQRIGGWLFLMAISLVVSPFRVGHMLASNYVPIFRDGTWLHLTTPGSESYHPLWAPLLVFEIIGSLGALILGLVALGCFAKQSRRTPKMVIVWLAYSAIYSLLDFFCADLIPMVRAAADPESGRTVIRACLGAAIWIPYFLVSQRVKATFVR